MFDSSFETKCKDSKTFIGVLRLTVTMRSSMKFISRSEREM